MLKTTSNTTKERLSFTVRFGDVSTSTALLRTISCIYKHNWNSSLKGFVSTKINQLSKAPQVQVLTLTLCKFSPLPDTLEIFKYDAISITKRLYKLFADNMIYLTADSSLLSRQPSQESFSSFCALLLERRPDFKVMVSNLFKIFNFKLNFIACSSNTVNTQINTYKSLYPSRWWNWIGKNYMEIKYFLSLIPHKSSRCWFLPFKKPKLIVTNRKPNILNPPLSCRERSKIITTNEFKRKSSCIIFNRGWPKLFNWPLRFSACTDSSYSTYYKICRKAIFLFDLSITKMLNFNLVRSFILNRNLKDIITGFGEFNQGIMENWLNFFRNFEFAFNGFNEFQFTQNITYYKNFNGGGGQFLPRLRPWASLPDFL
ncbi:MAG: hypothetical protein KatS3mg078_2041 [Deltaproteobacteria bacterium]|nr:MAG: hypothetical protein KatS3mg078_2041 [Deltaproteobacteria bacterium]